MSDSRTIALDSPTKKAVAVGLAALCLCVVGALLVVGRGSGGTSSADAARGASGAPQQPSGGPSDGSPGFGQGSGGLRGGGSTSFDELRQCLQDQGVTFPDPGRRGQAQRPDMSDTLRKAFDACRQYMPERPSGGSFGGPGDGNGPSGTPPWGQGGRSSGDESSDDSTF